MNRSRSNRLLRLTLAIAVTLVAICSCDEVTIYDNYRHIDPMGWERADTLNYDVSHVAQSGDYMEEIGLRLDDHYPFMQLCLIVEQTVIPTYVVRTDTVVCKVTTQNGTPRGHGVNYYQYQIPIGSIRLAEGDSLHVAIRHHMRRELLSGVAEVGLKIGKRNYATSK